MGRTAPGAGYTGSTVGTWFSSPPAAHYGKLVAIYGVTVPGPVVGRSEDDVEWGKGRTGGMMPVGNVEGPMGDANFSPCLSVGVPTNVSVVT